MNRRDQWTVAALLAVFALAAALAWWRGELPGWIAGLVAGALLLAAYLIVAGKVRRQGLADVATSLVPLVLVAALVIGAIIAFLPQDYENAMPALIAGTVLATGWMATALAGEVRRRRDDDKSRRDTLWALREEIFTILETLEKTDWAESARRIQRRIVQTAQTPNVADYFPFSATERRPMIFEALSAEVAGLDERTVRAIVRFYAEFNDLSSLVRDTQRGDFAQLNSGRRALFHQHLTNARRNTIYFALRAIFRINVVLGVARPGEIARGTHRNHDIELDREGLE